MLHTHSLSWQDGPAPVFRRRLPSPSRSFNLGARSGEINRRRAGRWTMTKPGGGGKRPDRGPDHGRARRCPDGPSDKACGAVTCAHQGHSTGACASALPATPCRLCATAPARTGAPPRSPQGPSKGTRRSRHRHRGAPRRSAHATTRRQADFLS
ncbi:hypothetical protein Salmuc_03806 [Salipiger mucosus DSM 16094]|uniref:Uncharacterized protein n=1 Tax=Salipiger mucosus DSM 16094 TaxID=1123237 RepID=S9RR23_9RHOB|nr:hypothetical protein Salmuc_03806 [Salipiger mucosus DSM 16094]